MHAHFTTAAHCCDISLFPPRCHTVTPSHCVVAAAAVTLLRPRCCCQAAAVPHRCGWSHCDFPSILAQTSLAGASRTFKLSTCQQQTARARRCHLAHCCHARHCHAPATPPPPAGHARRGRTSNPPPQRGGRGMSPPSKPQWEAVHDDQQRHSKDGTSQHTPVGKAGFEVWVGGFSVLCHLSLGVNRLPIDTDIWMRHAPLHCARVTVRFGSLSRLSYKLRETWAHGGPRGRFERLGGLAPGVRGL